MIHLTDGLNIHLTEDFFLLKVNLDPTVLPVLSQLRTTFRSRKLQSKRFYIVFFKGNKGNFILIFHMNSRKLISAMSVKEREKNCNC